MSKDNFDDLSEFLLGDQDTDNDGIANFNDCEPFNSEKQDSSLFGKAKGYLEKVGKRTKRGFSGNEWWVTKEDGEWWVWEDMPHHPTKSGRYPGRIGVYKSRSRAVSKARNLAEANRPSILHIEGKEIFLD